MAEFNFFNESPIRLGISNQQCLEVCETICLDHRKSFGWINVICMLNDEHTLLNNNYLGHNYATDVLTFDFAEKSLINGEIYINVDVAAQNAQEHSVTLQNEIQRLIVHGTLHLIGLDDNTEELRNEMHNLENYYLTRFM